MEQLRSDKELLSFWEEESESMASTLLSFLKDLSTKIPDNSKYPFYLYLNWRELDAEAWILLRIALHFLEDSYRSIEILKDRLLSYVLRELKDGLSKNLSRMANCKFNQFERSLSWSATPSGLRAVPLAFVPKEREWKGNYSKKLGKVLRRIYSLRFQTPKRVERQERVRGYRDHGSMSSVDERARREANTSYWSPQLEQVLRFIQETGADIHYALRIHNMELRE